MSDLRYTKDGVPVFDGSPELYVAYHRAALTYAETVEWKKRSLVGPRLQAALEGSAKLAVEHMAPGWISHDKGASQLLAYLKKQVRAPTLAEAGRTMSRFFYGIKRRRGEGMTAWIFRHDEALLEAKRTLAEAIHEYGPGLQPSAPFWGPTWKGQGHKGSRASAGSRTSDREQDLQGTDAATPEPSAETSTGQEEPGDGESQAWADDDWDTSSMVVVMVESWAAAYLELGHGAERFLPDFVVAWLLLQRSGLDATERSVLVANLKNDFSVHKVKEALKLTWPDEELKRRDSGKHSAMFTEEESAMLADDDTWEDIEAGDWDDPEDEYAYQALAEEAQEALAALQDAKRTLRDAREKQAQMRRNRRFFPSKGGGKGRGDRPPLKVNFVFTTIQERAAEPNWLGRMDEQALAAEAAEDHSLLALSHIIEEGKAITDH
ncbi:unnamed protein product [Symbiodinium pilosum]|uniref:Uncharacterized protein n=1 Tax=Symbiodinium pilosum TaxID=2952 RepID=A0A812Y805_SYMPI|nr:unnamed protein product [Symbiodinium pilosum]